MEEEKLAGTNRNTYEKAIENFKYLMSLYERFFNNGLERRVFVNAYLNEISETFRENIGERSWERITESWYEQCGSYPLPKKGLIQKMRVKNAAELFTAGKHLGIKHCFEIRERTTAKEHKAAYGFARKLLHKHDSVSDYFKTEEKYLFS